MSIATTCLAAGCAFQKSEKQQAAASASAPEYHIAITWNDRPQGTSNEELPLTRALDVVGANYVTRSAATLLADPPEILQLIETIQCGGVSNDSVVKARIQFTDRTVSLPAKITSINDEGTKQVLTLEVTGINTAFKSEKSSSGKLHLELSTPAGEMVTVEAMIRTPPSAIAPEDLSSTEFSAQEESRDFDFITPVVLGQQLSLIRVIKLVNEETLPTELQIPLTPSGGVMQRIRQYTVNRQECSYSRQATESHRALSSKILILPLDERFLEQAESGIRDNGGALVHSTVLRPKESISLGIYGIGSGVSSWLRNGIGGTRPENYTCGRGMWICLFSAGL